MPTTKSFHTSKTAVSLSSTLVDTKKYYEPTLAGLELAKELIAGVVSSRIADIDYILTAIEVVYQRPDITTLKVKTIRTLLTKLSFYKHKMSDQRFQILLTYLFDMFDEHAASDTDLQTIDYFYNFSNHRNGRQEFYQKIISKVIAYKLVTERKVEEYCKYEPYSFQEYYTRLPFLWDVIDKSQINLPFTGKMMENILCNYTNSLYIDKIVTFITIKFAPPLTQELVNVLIQYETFPYYYHSQAKITVPSSSTSSTSSTSKTYIETYPEFYEYLYLSRKKIAEIKSNEALFSKYKKDNLESTPFPSSYITTILNGKTLNKKFTEYIFKTYNCEITFPVFLKFVNSILSSDRKRSNVNFLADLMTSS